MHGRWLLLLTFSLLLSLLPGATQPTQADEGACLSWDISGVWAYSASGGGWGTFTFQQNLSNGWLTGSWINQAAGSSGQFDSGGIIGIAVGFHPSVGADWRGTVTPDGTGIRGNYTNSTTQTSGTWEMTGQARCLVRQPPPPDGTARVTVRWGDYVYRLVLEPSSTVAGRAPEEISRVQRIVGPFGVRLIIEAIYYGDNLPNRLQVNNRWDGRLDRLQDLFRSGTTEDGGTIYRGTVTIPQRVLGPGEVIRNEVRIVNPWGAEDLVTYVDQFIIDPSGYIRDAATNEPIQGAMATCYVKQGNDWVLWNAEAWKQTNPLVSNDEGHYGWDVPPGDYKVVVTHDCYQDAESPVVTIPPPRTDIHFSLQKVACSGLEMVNVWTADEGGLPETEFRPGEAIKYQAVISNTSNSDVTVDVVWNVTDPDGRRVDALSGSGEYVVASFGAGIIVDETLPTDLATGGYGLSMQLTHQQQTSGKVTQFWVQRTGDYAVHLPLGLRDYRSSTETPGIHGRVTHMGSPVEGIDLRLRFFNGDSWSTAATTRTDSDGRYRFSALSSQSPGQEYYVLFGPNTTMPQYLYNWLGPTITDYKAGTLVAGGDFDIANVDLVSPASGATVTLPAPFTWSRRGLAGDTYRWGLFDPSGDDSWWSDNLGDVGTFTLGALPPGGIYGKQYGWNVYVFGSPDSYGLSHYYRRVTLSPTQGPTIGPNLRRRPVLQDGFWWEAQRHEAETGP